MKQVWIFLKKALYPPKGIRYGVPPAAFTVVIVIFTLKQQDCVWAYPVYVTAAYGMAVVVMTVVKDVPKLKKKAKTGALMQKSKFHHHRSTILLRFGISRNPQHL